jgi:hypothetical protein
MAEPNAPTQTSEEFAQSLLDRKWDNEKAASRARKKANRINSAVSGLGMVVGGVNWVLQQQGRQKVMDLEESMVFDLAAARQEFNKDQKLAKAWAEREDRWNQQGLEVGPHQEAKRIILKQNGWDDNTWRSSVGETRDKLQIKIDDLALNLQNHHENSRETMERILNSDLSTVEAQVSLPYRRARERAMNRNLFSIFARNLGLIKEKEGTPQTLSEVQSFTKNAREAIREERRGKADPSNPYATLDDIVQRRRVLGLGAAGPSVRPDKQYVLDTDGTPKIVEGRNGRKFYTYRDKEGVLQNENVTALNKSPAALSLEQLAELSEEKTAIANRTGNYKELTEQESKDILYNINKQIFGATYEDVTKLNLEVAKIQAQLDAAVSEKEKNIILAKNSTIELARTLKLAETAVVSDVLKNITETQMSEAAAMFRNQAELLFGGTPAEFDQISESFSDLLKRAEINSESYNNLIEEFKANNSDLSDVQIEALKLNHNVQNPRHLKIKMAREHMAALSSEQFQMNPDDYVKMIEAIQAAYPMKQ